MSNANLHKEILALLEKFLADNNMSVKTLKRGKEWILTKAGTFRALKLDGSLGSAMVVEQGFYTDVKNSNKFFRHKDYILVNPESAESFFQKLLSEFFKLETETLEPILCPKCFCLMLVRTRKMDNKKFWGCGAYPTCSFTLNMPKEIQQELEAKVKSAV